MNGFSILRFATTLGIGSCLYNSLLKNQKPFKVNAQPQNFEEFDLSAIDLLEEVEFGPRSPCKVSTPKHRTGQCWASRSTFIAPLPTDPTISSLKCDRFVGSFNQWTKLPSWTLHHVERRNETDHSCDYCEAARTGDVYERRRVDNGPDLLNTYLDLMRNSQYDIDPCTIYTAPPQIHRASLQSNSLWDDLYHYIQFLVKNYKNVYVLSIPVITTEEFDSEATGFYTITRLSHFLKVILSETNDGSYRFECYKIPNKPIKVDHPDLVNYREPRSEIENLAEFSIFNDIKSYMVISTKMDPQFCSHWKCSQCFPPLGNERIEEYLLSDK